ncbi:hypothetical protein E1264_28365 [Actinomadura sp. KC216]|uniref:hypothetical protein n=1 Tax=Actinomadura sp. KC216 TaxID=2530370 RepID=UPI0010531305|nr:hypothetical protein [Actinomadura sp. KC216]TDB83440.1 hypothetical protein E1264_28365 [Actinomadura sp. KC216]
MVALPAAGLLSVGMLAGTGGTASAAASSASLNIGKVSGSNLTCLITVRGHAHLVQPNVTGLFLKVRGEDPVDDDEILDKGGFTSDAAGNFVIQQRIPCESLDEDWGVDEIYVNVTYRDPVLAKAFVIRSNTIKQSF